MRNTITKFFSMLLAAVLLVTSLGAVPVYADGVDGETAGYLVLGEDLTEEQRSTVLANLGVGNIEDYHVSYSTNAEEHEAFDAYLPSSVIGTKAYSSILLIPGEEGSGISVSTSNISYVTVAMYQNALISAGVSDVTVRVTAPFSVSGTAALVGAMNAYTIMTGEEISGDVSDAAVNELVTTGNLGDEIGDNDTAAEVMATLKEEVASSDDSLSDAELADAVDDACEEFDVDVSDDTKDEIVTVLKKLQDSDALDEGTLQEQASDLYDSISGRLESLGVDTEEAMGFFQRIWNAIVSFFRNLFNSLFGANEDDTETTEAETGTVAETVTETAAETVPETEATAAGSGDEPAASQVTAAGAEEDFSDDPGPMRAGATDEEEEDEAADGEADDGYYDPAAAAGIDTGDPDIEE